MRATTFVLVLLIFMAVPAVAQEWTEYHSVRDGFKVDFPGQPTVTETTWRSEHGFMLPERIYTVEKGRERYTVSVMDYRGIEPMGLERAKSCPPGSEPCLGSDLSGIGYWKHEIRGAVANAMLRLMQRNVKVTDFFWTQLDLVEGFQLQMINNADQSPAFAFVAMHDNRLYVVEGFVPKGYPAPALFQTSMGWLDKDGNAIRYQTLYANEFHGMGIYPPPPHGGGGGAGGGGQGQGGGRGRRGGGAGTPSSRNPTSIRRYATLDCGRHAQHDAASAHQGMVRVSGIHLVDDIYVTPTTGLPPASVCATRRLGIAASTGNLCGAAYREDSGLP